MRDKRPVDELSIEELERILIMRKREARLARLHEYGQQGRMIPVTTAAAAESAEVLEPLPAEPPPAEVPTAEVAMPSAAIEPSAVSVAAPENDTAASAETVAELEDLPAKPEYFEGEPRFEDEQPRPKARPTRQRIAAKKQIKPAGAMPAASLRTSITPGAAISKPAAAPTTATSPRVVLTPRAKLWNRFLAGVEIAAVIGLIALAFILWQSIQAIERKTAAEQAAAQATILAARVAPTATPIINLPVTVLPTGHKYEGNGQGSFNFDEIPAQYRAQYAALLAQLPQQARPTPLPEAPTRIRIPKLNVDNIVVYGDDFEALKQGVGHHIGSANPGQTGNLILAAHNDIYGQIFRDLDKLVAGDEVYVSTISQEYRYVVGESIKVKPDETSVLEQTSDQRLTLISCWPYRVNDRRIVVFATLTS